MTSLERHEARYQRRKAKRKRKRIEFAQQYLANDVFSTLSLVNSYNKCKRGVLWKPSVQAYGANIVINSRQNSKAIHEGTWKTKGFHEFNIVERGKPRHIKSVNVAERCIQRSLCDNCITPILSHYLIYDNGATLKNKGTDFALNRFTKHLRDFYKKYGRDGYILFFDFSQYFANINIKQLEKLTDKYIPDSLHKTMYYQFIDVFQNEGLGLGSQVSQISAVFYANELDHMIKDQLGKKFYARYMDDGYIIEHDLNNLKSLLQKIQNVCDKLGIVLNKKKCQIIPLHKQFKFLKIRFFITETGKVVRRLNRNVQKKERKKLIKFKIYLLENKMALTKIYNMFHSWLYSQKRGKNYHVMKSMTNYYNKTFNECYITKKPKKSKSNKQYHTIKYICTCTNYM